MRRLIRDIVPSSPSVGAPTPAVGHRPGALSSPSSDSSPEASRRRERHHELGVTTSQPELDRPRRELGGDLLGRRRQGVLQRQPDRRVQRRGETLGERTSLITPRPGRDLQLAVDALYVRSKVHGAIMAPLRAIVNS